MPRKLIPYEQKKESSKKAYLNFFERVYNSNKTIDVLKRANLKQWNKYFPNNKLSNNEALNGQKRLLNQVKRDYKHVVNDYLIKKGIQNVRGKQHYFNETIRQYKIREKEITELDEIKFKRIRDKKGNYGAVELTDLKNDNKYWIKYTDKKSFESHFNKLIQEYSITNYTMRYIGTFMRVPYIKEKFKKNIIKELS